MKKQSLPIILVLGLGGLQIVPVASADDGQAKPGAYEQNQTIEWVTTLFKSFCHRDPDPASLNAYVNAAREGRQSASQIHDAVAKSCGQSGQKQAFEPCQHVSGIKDICGPASN